MSSKRRRPGPALTAALLGDAALTAAFYFKPLPALEDRGLLVSDDSVLVESGTAGLSFAPKSGAKSSGLVFYCGARIPPEAYAYLARACAKAGYTAVLSSMPLNVATLAPSRAYRAASAYPGVRRWVIAGHSLGGAAAATFVARNAAAKAGAISVAGLLLIASYPGSGADLSTKSLIVVTVGASRDALASPARIAAAGGRLPAGSRYVEIAGGNHAQFGEYGPQSGDGIAEIPGLTQRKATVDEAISLLDRVEAGAGK
jgi:pimeloyl-ACP methyl ester carboxylesterase